MIFLFLFFTVGLTERAHLDRKAGSAIKGVEAGKDLSIQRREDLSGPSKASPNGSNESFNASARGKPGIEAGVSPRTTCTLSDLFKVVWPRNMRSADGTLYFLNGDLLQTFENGSVQTISTGVTRFEILEKQIVVVRENDEISEVEILTQKLKWTEKGKITGLKFFGDSLYFTLEEKKAVLLRETDLKSKKTVTKAEFGSPTLIEDISLDGAFISLTISHPEKRSEAILLNRTTGSETRIEGPSRSAHFTKDSKHVFFLKGQDDFFQLFSAALDDLKSAKPLTRHKWGVEEFGLSVVRSQLAIHSRTEGLSNLEFFSIGPKGTQILQHPLPKWEKQVIEEILPINSASVLAVTSHSTKPPEIVSFTPQGPHAISSFHPWYRPGCLISETKVQIPSFDKRNLSAFQYGEKGGPTLVVLGKTPQETFLPRFHPAVQYHALQGVRIIAPQLRGQWGSGFSFEALDNGNKREDAARDLISVVRWASAKKVYVWGEDYGGWLARKASALDPTFTPQSFGSPWFKVPPETPSPLWTAFVAKEYGSGESSVVKPELKGERYPTSGSLAGARELQQLLTK